MMLVVITILGRLSSAFLAFSMLNAYLQHFVPSQNLSLIHRNQGARLHMFLCQILVGFDNTTDASERGGDALPTDQNIILYPSLNVCHV
jgi:hypothetical protein